MINNNLQLVHSPVFGFDRKVISSKNVINALAIFPLGGQIIGAHRLWYAISLEHVLRATAEIFCLGIVCVIIDIFKSTLRTEAKALEDSHPIFVEMTYEDGSKYWGEMKDGQKEGVGRFSFSDGSYQEGFFEKDLFSRGRYFTAASHSLIEDEGLNTSDQRRLDHFSQQFFSQTYRNIQSD